MIRADQIFLKNGDRLTGRIISKDSDKITIETEAAGKVVIKWASVERIEADQVLTVELKDGSTLAGIIDSGDERLEVSTEEGKEITVAATEIAAIRNEREQAAYEAKLLEKADGSFFNRWTATADVGFSLTTGNSKTRSLNFGTRGIRQSEKDKLTLYARGVQSSNSTSGISVTTAQAIWFGGRYDRYLNKKTFIFGTADFEYDKPQQLNLRAVGGGGFGYRWMKNDHAEFDLFGGLTVNREYFDLAGNRTSAEALIGEELSLKFTKSTKLEQRFELYPSVSRAGTVRARFDASLVTALNSWLGWHVSVGDRFNSDPVPGNVQNDLLFSTGLRATFGKKKE